MRVRSRPKLIRPLVRVAPPIRRANFCETLQHCITLLPAPQYCISSSEEIVTLFNTRIVLDSEIQVVHGLGQPVLAHKKSPQLTMGRGIMAVCCQRLLKKVRLARLVALRSCDQRKLVVGPRLIGLQLHSNPIFRRRKVRAARG